jgi:hypothetical protein
MAIIDVDNIVRVKSDKVAILQYSRYVILSRVVIKVASPLHVVSALFDTYPHSLGIITGAEY